MNGISAMWVRLDTMSERDIFSPRPLVWSGTSAASENRAEIMTSDSISERKRVRRVSQRNPFEENLKKLKVDKN